MRDVIACAITFLVIVLLVLRSHGAELEAPADPSSSYVARPEWYFLPLFQLLKYFEGPLEVIGTMVLPGLAGGLLIALPFIDRSHTRDPRRRLAVLVGAVIGFAGVVALGVLASRGDQASDYFKRQRIEAQEKSETARKLALQGVSPEGGVAVFRNDPYSHARELWEEKCAGCNSLTGTAGKRVYRLANYNSRAGSGISQQPRWQDGLGPANLEKGMKPSRGRTRSEGVDGVCGRL